MQYDFTDYSINQLALALDKCRHRFEMAHQEYLHAETDLHNAQTRLAKAIEGSAQWYHAKDAIKQAEREMLAADEAGGKELEYKQALERELLARQPRFNTTPQVTFPRLRDIIARLLFPRLVGI